VTPGQRRQRLDGLLPEFHSLWHAQPFRDLRPDWCARWPAMSAELLALDDAATAHLNDNAGAALTLLARHLPAVAELAALAELPRRSAAEAAPPGERWAWEIPGRKRSQIEAFAAAAQSAGVPVIDWCGGKGHLGRLLALHWSIPVTTLEIDPVLCAEGEALARRLSLAQDFVLADALASEPPAASQAVALHACGELHRRLIVHGAMAGVARFDVAPCCYHRGVGDFYQPLSAGLQTRLTRDDTRLAVTETVTASPRLARQRDKEMAWKLGFAEWQRLNLGAYRNFKPVPAAWFRGSFADFLSAMGARSALPAPSAIQAGECELAAWQRQREVMRLSIVRHAFRRLLEIWLALDLVAYLEEQGYAVELGAFCGRHLTPRNLLISAWR
jgi:hypothetical protein